MKRIFSILVGVSMLALGSGLVAACSSSDDNDFSSDPNYKGPAYVTLNVMDTTYVEKEKFIAKLDVNGEFILLLDEFGDGNQKFNFKVLRFQEGNFPTNLNPMSYLVRTGELSYDAFSSADINDPTRNNGMIKIANIDKEAMLVSGSFNSLMVPSGENQTGLKSFKISGEFKNIPYTRSGMLNENGFVYMALGDQEMKDLKVVSNAKGDIQNGRAVIKAESVSLRKRSIEINFPKESTEGTYGYDQVNVIYTSENGVKYYSNVLDNALAGSMFKIESIFPLRPTDRTSYRGKFLFKLKSKEGHIITLEFGDFSATLLMKESQTPTVPGPGDGSGPIEL